VSALSQAIAAQLGVTYDPNNPIGSDAPKLLGVPADEQIVTSLAGVGGEVKVAGFFLSSLLLRAQEGNLLDDLDPAHLRFLDAPVYIFDIKLSDTLTLDGILGMNFLSASTFVEGDGVDFAFLAGRESPFSAVVFNESDGTLGLEPTGAPGDANLDGKVDIGDLGLLAGSWQQLSGMMWADGDFTYDGRVDIADLGLLAGNWQKGTPGNPPLDFNAALAQFAAFEGVVVPEPTGAALALGTLAGRAMRRRRRRA
jgi:hypothetical protein